MADDALQLCYEFNIQFLTFTKTAVNK